MDGGITMRRNDNYLWWFCFAAMWIVISIIWFLERHHFWATPWPMAIFFMAVELFYLVVGFVKWRKFKKENH